jgi:hypothetical protein
MLRLIRASKSRPSGTWSDDDYDVFDGEQHIGRIVWSYAAPPESARHKTKARRLRRSDGYNAT